MVLHTWYKRRDNLAMFAWPLVEQCRHIMQMSSLGSRSIPQELQLLPRKRMSGHARHAGCYKGFSKLRKSHKSLFNPLPMNKSFPTHCPSLNHAINNRYIPLQAKYPTMIIFSQSSAILGPQRGRRVAAGWETCLDQLRPELVT